MTIEKAIWRLETCLMCDDCSTCGTHDEAIELAVRAMKAVRGHCVYCKNFNLMDDKCKLMNGCEEWEFGYDDE